ncbi:hypothetical protein KIW84_044048 [Lathyrus oleraceus]|uniref:Uncharacterized protein n=2 Tax=Pisum sativum TaxID=3888 RepID=A0A9D4XJ81_PEA|nr:hypothetical protein KIW84_044048 [Pisum sativum]
MLASAVVLQQLWLAAVLTTRVVQVGNLDKVFRVASIIATLYTIQNAIGSAAITRVSNALGAGHPQATQLFVYAAMTPAVSNAILISSTIFLSRRIVGYIFSNRQDILVNQNDRTNFVCCHGRMSLLIAWNRNLLEFSRFIFLMTTVLQGTRFTVRMVLVYNAFGFDVDCCAYLVVA